MRARIILAALCFTGITTSAPAATCAFTAPSLLRICWASPCEQRGTPQARFPQEPQLVCTSVHLRGGGASGEHDEHDLWWQRSRAAARSLLNLERILLEAQSAAQPGNDDSDAILEEDSKEDVADMAMQDCVRRFKSVLVAPSHQKAGALAGQSLRCLSSSPFVCPCSAQTGADGRRASAVVALTQFLHTFFVGTDMGKEKGDVDGCTLLQDGEWPGSGSPGAAHTAHTNRLGGNSMLPEVCAAEDARRRTSCEPVDGMRAREAVCEALALDMMVLLAPLEACCVCGNRVRSILHAFVSVGDRRSRLGTMMGALELLARAGLQMSFLPLLGDLARLARLQDARASSKRRRHFVAAALACVSSAYLSPLSAHFASDAGDEVKDHRREERARGRDVLLPGARGAPRAACDAWSQEGDFVRGGGSGMGSDGGLGTIECGNGSAEARDGPRLGLSVRERERERCVVALAG